LAKEIIEFTGIRPKEIIVYRRRRRPHRIYRIEVVDSEGRTFVFTNIKRWQVKPLSRLANLAGFSLANPTEVVERAITEKLPALRVRAYQADDGKWIAVLVVGDDYLLVRHREVFNVAAEVLGWGPDRVEKLRRGQMAVWENVSSMTVPSADISLIRAHLAVTNAVTGDRSVRVFYILEYEPIPGVSYVKYSRAIRHPHRGASKERFLERVKRAVEEVYNDVDSIVEDVASAIVTLANIPYMTTELAEMLEKRVERLPKKYTEKLRVMVKLRASPYEVFTEILRASKKAHEEGDIDNAMALGSLATTILAWAQRYAGGAQQALKEG